MDAAAAADSTLAAARERTAGEDRWVVSREGMRADAEVAATDEVGTLLSCARAAALALLVRTGSGTFAGATAALREVVMGLYARFMDMACRACSFSVYELLETVVCVLCGCTGGIPA